MGDLPIGGESGIGRGRLKGISAVLSYGAKTWTIKEGENGALDINGDRELLQSFLTALGKGE